MFKGKVRIYKNVNWKQTSFKKNFHNEDDFNKFLENNPDFKDLKNWENSKLPENLFEINNFFDEAFKLWNDKFFKEIEDALNKLFEKSKKLIGN